MRIGDATTADNRPQRAAQPRRVDAPVSPAAEAPGVVTRQASAAPPVEVPKIESVTRQIDSFLRSINRSVQFRVDQASGEMVVSICDAETGEVIRQVPGEEALRIAERIEAQLSAVLDETA
jgi:flagellar protein FlaG